MLGRIASCLLLGIGIFLAIVWGIGHFRAEARHDEERDQAKNQVKAASGAFERTAFATPSNSNDPAPGTTAKSTSRRSNGAPLYAMAPQQAPAAQGPATRRAIVRDPIVIPKCTLGLVFSEDVPAQRDGVLLFLGTPIKPEERSKLPPELVGSYKVGDKVFYYRILKKDDQVEAGQLLGLVKPDLAVAERDIKDAKVGAAVAEKDASIKTEEEAFQRYLTQDRLYRDSTRAASLEDLRGAKLTHERYKYEVIGKKAAVTVAQKELNQANTTVAMYEIRADIAGRVQEIHKKVGEAVKNLDPVVRIVNADRLEVMGHADIQNVRDLRKDMEVVVEPIYRDPPAQSFPGHQGKITSIAVSKDTTNPYIVTGSTDDAKVWDRASRTSLRTYLHDTAVNVVACTPPGSEADLCLTGDQAGKIRLFDLASSSEKPVKEFSGRHRKEITAAAFGPGGKYCATASDDGQIILWEVASGTQMYSMNDHRAKVTSLSFTPDNKLVSADPQTVRVWELREKGAHAIRQQRRQRSDVAQVGVSPDGKFYLGEFGSEIRVMSLENDATEAILRNPPRDKEFQTLSQFAPNWQPSGGLVLTATNTPGLLQLWKTSPGRSHEIRELLGGDSTIVRSRITCASIAPNMQFVAAGCEDGKLFVWSMPTPQELAQVIKGKIVSKDPSTSADGRVQVTAEIANPGNLFSGDEVTMVIYPTK